MHFHSKKNIIGNVISIVKISLATHFYTKIVIGNGFDGKKLIAKDFYSKKNIIGDAIL